MTVEEILAALQAIIDEAGDAELSDEQVARYQELEGRLTAARQRVELRSRHDAYMTGTGRIAPAGGGAAGEPDAEVIERAFDGWVRTGVRSPELAQFRAQEAGVPAEGGYLVPDGFRQKLIERRKRFGGLASVVEEFTTATGQPIEWPTMDDTANVGGIVDEEAAIPTSGGADLVFGTETLGAYKYGSGGASNLPLKVSWELLQDSAFDVEGLVSRALMTRIARAQAAHWVSGSGVGEPLGITTGVTGIEIAADTAGITYADLVNFKHSIDPDYREGAVWAFNDNTAADIEALVDLNGRPLLRSADLGIENGGEVLTLLGHRVIIDQAFPDLDADANTVNWGVFGQLREAYVIRRVKAFTLVALRELYAATGQTGFIGWERADGTVQNPNAYICMTGEQ